MRLGERSLGIRGVDLSFKLIAPRNKRVERHHYRTEIRVKRSEKIGEEYFDVLIGKKATQEKEYRGIRRDQSILFEELRLFLRALSRTIDSEKMGQLADKTKVYDISRLVEVPVRFSRLEISLH
jgi:hypothetical protein